MKKWWMQIALLDRLSSERRKQCIHSWCEFHFKNSEFVHNATKDMEP